MYYYKLKKKSIICIEGKDAISFIQGIITNNTNKLKNNRVIYSTLLSPQGKLLHDFFLFKNLFEIRLNRITALLILTFISHNLSNIFYCFGFRFRHNSMS